ncbi:hypothetical protein AUJ84_03635 [Candidatus Pacearchaeota archaeon CG1_02_32_132]|nr:MAG: hypothetical protein AUJ84_03635 [Candidatus Pacearchaeota archaeon CG1_02_32_132]
MLNKQLVNFIKESRKRGFDDFQIRKPLMDNGWPIEEIENAFASLKKKPKFKNKICIYLDSDIIRVLEKRAKKNMFTLTEQIEDILRRSTINLRTSKQVIEKLDDSLIPLFSRRQR